MKHLLILALGLLIILLVLAPSEPAKNDAEELVPRLRSMTPPENWTSESAVFPVEPLQLSPLTRELVVEVKVELPRLKTPSLDYNYRRREPVRSELWELPVAPPTQWVYEVESPQMAAFQVPNLEESGKDWLPPRPAILLPTAKRYELPDLAYQPTGNSKLRPMSPYCMPGHTSQNFVLYSMHDGLPLHPGVW